MTDNKVLEFFDGADTAISEQTWDAALHSAGSVIEAVDAVMQGQCRNAFCAGRPPGHHAGIFGKTFHEDDKRKACSNGFCFINNVALASSYVMSQYRDKVRRWNEEVVRIGPRTLGCAEVSGPVVAERVSDRVPLLKEKDVQQCRCLVNVFYGCT